MLLNLDGQTRFEDLVGLLLEVGALLFFHIALALFFYFIAEFTLTVKALNCRVEQFDALKVQIVLLVFCGLLKYFTRSKQVWVAYLREKLLEVFDLTLLFYLVFKDYTALGED